jgi:hypothetical protein
MSTVCSTLRKAWIYHPNLDFDISTVPASSRHNIMQGLKRFIDTVNFVLREHSGLALNRLAVNFELHKEHAHDIDGWVSFAISSKARVGCSIFLHIWDNMKIIIASHVIFLTTKIHLTLRSFDLIVLLWIQVENFVAFQILQHLLWSMCLYCKIYSTFY